MEKVFGRRKNALRGKEEDVIGVGSTSRLGRHYNNGKFTYVQIGISSLSTSTVSQPRNPQ